MPEENEVAEAQPAVEEAPAPDPQAELFEEKRAAFVREYSDRVPALNRALNTHNRLVGEKLSWSGATIDQSAYHFARLATGQPHRPFPSWIWLKGKVAQIEKRG